MGSPKVSVALVCLIALAISSSFNAQNSPQDFLDVHNAARAQVGVGNMTWNSTVAANAQSHANQTINACTLETSNGSFGETISIGNDPFTGVDAVQRWVSGGADYDYNNNSCRTGSVLCLAYIQVVWRNTTRLGCARARCTNNSWFVICNYDPPGDILGQRPY